MGFLIIIRGPLGIGKTTISKIFAERTNSKYISMEGLLTEAKLDKVDPKLGCVPLANFLAVQEDVLPDIENYLKRQNVVLDGNFYHKEQIEFFVNHLIKNVFVVTLKAKLETCIDRDKKKDHPDGAGAVKIVFNLVSKFDYGYCVTAEGKTREQIVEQIRTWLRKVGAQNNL